MSAKTPLQAVAEEVGTWPGITVDNHGRDGTQLLFGTIELGHMHGWHVAHLPMPRAIRNTLIEEGRATAHPVLSDSGWIQRLIASSEDARDVIALFRMNYERVSSRARFSTRA